MGDLLEDVQMIRKTEHDVVLKIGFLNDMEGSSEKMVEEFIKTYDIVITGDGSLQPVNYLLTKIFKNELLNNTNNHLTNLDQVHKATNFGILENILV